MINSKDLLTKSVYISLIIQVITGIVTFKGMFMNVSKNDFYNQLKDVCPHLNSKSQPSSFYVNIK